jgi:hypothetical protein
MCREHLPVWEQWISDRSADNEVLMTVAADPLGSDRVRPIVEELDCKLPVLIDDEGILASTYGVNMTPTGFVISPAGTLTYIRVGTFEVHDPNVRREVREALSGRASTSPSFEGATDTAAKIAAAIERGAARYRQGDLDGAVAAWEKGLEIDPDNYILSTSIWAARHPEDFYPDINGRYRAIYAEFMDSAGVNWRDQ